MAPTCDRDDDGALMIEVTFDSARQARSALGELPVQEDLRHRAELVLSELATNALMHAAPPFVFRARYDGHWLRIEVRDSSPVLPVMAGETAMRGRGLRIVAALSSGWGAVPEPGGKVVWAELG